MRRQICQEQTDLSPADILQLEEVSKQLPLMAELTGADVFIDCPTKDGDIVVVAQAQPSSGSAYEKSVVGVLILPLKEPAVFSALKNLSPVRDIKAITQENHTVRQDVVPIFNPDQTCIALLIREMDISDDVLQEKKYQSLARTYEKADSTLRSSDTDADTTTLREVHHRVKITSSWWPAF